MPNWTKEQNQAIYEDGTDILVSAGAGSGKTEILSERALRKVKEGVDIDRILILTFTKAAAYEMMVRIRDKIMNVGLKDQVNRIEKAYITTFDSFSLSIVKKYHDRLNLTKEISVIDENIISLKKKEYLEEILEEYYQNSTPKFEKLISDFGQRDDKKLKRYLVEISNQLDLKCDKKEYLDSYLTTYFSDIYIKKIKQEYFELLQQEIEEIKKSLKVLELSVDGDYYQKLIDVLYPLLSATSYEKIKVNLNIKLPSLPKHSEETVQNVKKTIKKEIEKLEAYCIYDSETKLVEDYLSTKDYIEVMIEIIQKLDRKIDSYKRKHHCFEFIDIAKQVITLVKENSDIQDELKNYFHEIMIDEYQDTSDVQEELISLISNHNTYMVGDIKQSIYRFRNANPMIFKEKYDNFSKNIGGVKIDLNKNFRSREEVLANINQIFRYVMDDKIGGANYPNGHQMVFGNTSYSKEGKIDLDSNMDIYTYEIEKDSPYRKYSEKEVEAFMIASDIKKKIKEKYQIFDKKTKKLRDAEYQDFVILMDRSNDFNLYKKIFEYLQIPLTILKDENIINQNEVYLIRNILKLIECLEKEDFENTFRYSFVSIARSYLSELTDSEIFSIVQNNTYQDTEIIKKTYKLLHEIPSLDLYSLLSRIKEEFDFDYHLIRIGNVKMGITVLEYFLTLSQTLQQLGYDYHRFITYLDDIIENKRKIEIPVSVLEENSCRIMTIHKSKGLEYPICYYSRLFSEFNDRELKEQILLDSKYGIVTPSFLDGYHDTFVKELVKKKFYLEEIGERIRLFYVALTRCKEKMILVTKENLDSVELSLKNGFVENNIREKYRTFNDILKSIGEEITNRVVNISLEDLPLTQEYRILSNSKLKPMGEKEKLVVNEYKVEEKILEKTSFSKKITMLLDEKTKKNMEFGTKIHALFEIINFENPELNQLELSEFEKSCIQDFLNQPILKDSKHANILKEYEFYTVDENNQEKHGIIDLLLEYDDRIDIIDYKLKHIDDSEYQKQLIGYQEYIKKRIKKPVNIYLYSIMNRKLERVNSKENVLN